MFVMTNMLVFPVQFVALQWRDKRGKKIAHAANILWGIMLYWSAFTWFSAKFTVPLDRKQTYVFVANHRSYVDIPGIYATLHRWFRFLGKDELRKIPMMGYMYARLHLLVKREDKLDRLRSYKECLRALADGDSIVIFPEGTTKTYTQHIDPDNNPNFNDGAFLLAIQAQVPIVPIAIRKATRVLSNDGYFLFLPFGHVRVVYGKPVVTKGRTKDDLIAVRTEVVGQINQMLA